MDTNFYAKSDVMSQLVESDFKHLIGLIADLDDIWQTLIYLTLAFRTALG